MTGPASAQINTWDATPLPPGQVEVDLFHFSGDAQSELRPALASRRSGAQTDWQLGLRWRFYDDEESGFSAALVGGPMLLNAIDTTVSSSPFLGWDQGLVFEKRLGDLTVDLDLYCDFPPAQRRPQLWGLRC